jgi:hypothetical protein
MPFELTKIGRLGDYNGTWSMGIRCRCCGHARMIPASFLIRLYGREKRLSTIAPRFRCSPCSGRDCACAGKDFDAFIWIPR